MATCNCAATTLAPADLGSSSSTAVAQVTPKAEPPQLDPHLQPASRGNVFDAYDGQIENTIDQRGIVQLSWCNPISIRIAFSDNSAIRIRCASDRESIVVDDRSLEGPYDMAKYGTVEVHELTDRFSTPVAGQVIAAASKIIDGNDVVVGLALVGSSDPILCVWNHGDELYHGSFDAMVEQDWGVCPRISDAFAVK